MRKSIYNASGVFTAFTELERELGRRSGVSQSERHKDGAFEFVPLYGEYFANGLEAALKVLDIRDELSSRIKFIDVGCGIGSKVLLAQMLCGFSVACYGIESEPRYVKQAQTWCGKDHIFCEDAREHDYAPYDIIYFYRPMIDPKGQEALERRIIETAKVGALILGYGHMYKLWKENPHMEELGHHNLYRKVK